MKPIWFKNHVAYTMAKYGMSMCVLGMAEELKPDGIAVNAVWPKTGILLYLILADIKRHLLSKLMSDIVNFRCRKYNDENVIK